MHGIANGKVNTGVFQTENLEKSKKEERNAVIMFAIIVYTRKSNGGKMTRKSKIVGMSCN